jgi:hypothetical protein
LKRELEGKRSPSNIVIMERLSQEYGWTPNQIREMSQEDVIGYIETISIKNQLEKAKQNKNGRN